MKKIIYLFLVLISHLSIAQTSEFIHIDQFGYRPAHTKVAVISNPIQGFNSNQSFTPNLELQVKNASTHNVVFTANIQSWNGGITHSQSGDQGWWFDFSTVRNNFV